MAGAAFAVDLGEVFKCTSVSVLQSIDPGLLQGLLQQLLAKQASIDQQLRKQQEELDALNAAQQDQAAQQAAASNQAAVPDDHAKLERLQVRWQ